MMVWCLLFWFLAAEAMFQPQITLRRSTESAVSAAVHSDALTGFGMVHSRVLKTAGL
jgi:hypothetical protein